MLEDLLPRTRRLTALRAAWGQPGSADGARANRYFDLLRNRRDPAAVVDDRTWSDLEFPKLFTDLDTTITPIGRQYLFNQLRTCEYGAEELQRRHEAYALLQADGELRERIQLALRPLADDSTAFIADLLLGPAPQMPRYRVLVLPWVLLSILTVAGAIAHLVPAWMCWVVLAVNAVIAIKVDPMLGRNADALLDCGRLLGVADRIAAAAGRATVAYLAQAAAQTPERRRLMPQVRWLALLDRARSIEIVGGVVVFLNFFLLLKLALYTRSVGRFATSRERWLSTFELIGAVDAAIAVANFLGRYPAHCRPAVTEAAVIDIENGYHALITKPVTNSVKLVNRSALVTGSNMTGKTTFIKMIAMNAILGHTLGICLADRATIPRSPVRALIRGGDQSVEAGKSRYFAEAEAIRGFMDESAGGGCRIFVIDEPFSGTNTVERIAAAKAVLRAIGARAQVLVTTHDVELQHLLGEGFELFHFQEDPAVEGFFDHRLRPGAGTQRNAIRVLERLGFAPEVITEALATVAMLDR